MQEGAGCRVQVQGAAGRWAWSASAMSMSMYRARTGHVPGARGREGSLSWTTSHFPLPTSHFLLPTSYFLLPTSYFLLPTSYSLLTTNRPRLFSRMHGSLRWMSAQWSGAKLSFGLAAKMSWVGVGWG